MATTFNKNAVNFSFDSWRTASNWSVDYNWWQKCKAEQVLSNLTQEFFASKGLATYGCQFTQAGVRIDPRHAAGLVATNAVSSLAASNTIRSEFVDALWNTPVPERLVERYYDGLLYIMSYLQYSGNYRIYVPK